MGNGTSNTKTLHTVRVGNLRIVRRQDGGIYIADATGRSEGLGFEFLEKAMRLGSSAAICEQLAEGFREMASEIRNGDPK